MNKVTSGKITLPDGKVVEMSEKQLKKITLATNVLTLPIVIWYAILGVFDTIWHKLVMLKITVKHYAILSWMWFSHECKMTALRLRRLLNI